MVILEIVKEGPLRRILFLYREKMGNQVSHSGLKRVWDFLGSFPGLVSAKRRKYKLHQLEINKIMKRILEIKKKRPELSKYLNEIPEFSTNENDSEIKLADLRRYHTRLLELLEKYESESNKRYWFI
jgi:hypothetical protein